MLKKITFFTVLLNIYSFPLFAESSCSHKVKELKACAQVEWKLGPKFGIFSKAQVKLSNEAGAPLKNAPALEFYPWMTMQDGHEHGARETVTKKLADGIYEVSMIHLMKMPGQWYLRIKKEGTKSKSDYLVSIPIEVK